MTAKAFQIKLCRRSPINSFPQSSNGFLQPRPLSHRKLLQVEHVGYGSKVIDEKILCDQRCKK